MALDQLRRRDSVSNPAPDRTVSQQEFDQIHAALAGLRFGSISIIVQDGVVVQIDRVEKRRISRTGGASSA